LSLVFLSERGFTQDATLEFCAPLIKPIDKFDVCDPFRHRVCSWHVRSARAQPPNERSHSDSHLRRKAPPFLAVPAKTSTQFPRCSGSCSGCQYWSEGCCSETACNQFR